jgi:flagellar biosynthetic protein FlhB
MGAMVPALLGELIQPLGLLFMLVIIAAFVGNTQLGDLKF